MAYVKDELRLITGAGGGFGKTWRYETTDAPNVVAAANYISDAQSLGMDVGDVVQIVQFASTAKATLVAFDEVLVSAVSSSGATLNKGSGTVTAVAGAATLNAMQGIVTSEALTTAAGAEYTLTLTNSAIALGDFVLATADAATSAGTPGIGGCTVTANQVIITVTNHHASNAFNAAIKIGFRVIKP